MAALVIFALVVWNPYEADFSVDVRWRMLHLAGMVALGLIWRGK